MSKAEMSRVERAIKVAFKAHRGTLRDGSSPLPYFTHPVDVVNRLRYVGGIVDEDVLCAAALHDTLEETELQPADIFEKFGERVTDLVLEMTRIEPELPDGITEEEAWHLRSTALLAEISRMSAAAKTIKLADRASNLTAALVTRKGEALRRYLRQSEWVLEQIPREVSPALWDSVHEMLQKPV
ncbi:MAG: HD domain-containing protein [Fimbriimonadales bacterium]